MNKKKLLWAGVAVAVILAVVLCFTLTRKPQNVQEDVTMGEDTAFLTGEVLSVTDDALLLKDAQQGEVQVNLSADTVWEGITRGELQAGQFAWVDYNGALTRSIPPQAAGLRVAVHAVRGVVTAVEEDGVLMTRADGQGELRLTLPEGAESPAVGAEIVAYTNGVQTMSLPPIANALGITVQPQE